MSRMPGFNAEGALLERTQRHYCTAGVARSSGSVEPTFSRFGTDPHLLGVQLLHLKDLQECLLCCLSSCWPDACICLTGGCECLPHTASAAAGGRQYIL